MCVKQNSSGCSACRSRCIGRAWRVDAYQFDTPVLADESVFVLEDLVEVIRHDAADLVNVKLAKCGGLTPALERDATARLAGGGVVV